SGPFHPVRRRAVCPPPGKPRGSLLGKALGLKISNVAGWTLGGAARQDETARRGGACQWMLLLKNRNPLTNSGFAGLRGVAFESRMAQEASGLIERHGGVAIVAPSMREVPLGENPAAFAFARRLMAGELDVVIFLTGVGAKALFDVLSGAHSQQALAQALTR